MSTGTETVEVGYGDQLIQGFLDYGRHRFIDVEQNNDTNNTQDRADIASANSAGNVATRSVAGLPLWGWGLGLIGSLIVFKLVR